MTIKKKKRQHTMTNEPTLYELDAEQALAGRNGLDASGEMTQATQRREYVETEDEKELRSLIFSTSDTVEELMDIPEWRTPDGKIMQILLRALNARERAQFVQSQSAKQDMAKGYADIAVMACRHPRTKKLLFQPADRDELLKKQGKVIERIAFRVSQLSGLDEADMDTMKKK